MALIRRKATDGYISPKLYFTEQNKSVQAYDLGGFAVGNGAGLVADKRQAKRFFS